MLQYFFDNAIILTYQILKYPCFRRGFFLKPTSYFKFIQVIVQSEKFTKYKICTFLQSLFKFTHFSDLQTIHSFLKPTSYFKLIQVNVQSKNYTKYKICTFL